ncbi:hypothetical protein HPP92_007734 [Vanilla planifolia]|uniref:Transcription factor CBF/NF-Y/archaeal histone domain-containing protein n=1 Tax=Vanilla planifolia TaxID=51239 RepID=A0A835REF4_VANPL|nr:hypothetical protein HPP92_007734 [Vanilla planifolia]
MADSDNESGGQNNSSAAGNGDFSSPREQDRLLPIANVSRIMKKALPANAKISKDAKETVQECVSEFISFITGEASDKCQKEKRKTINGDDLLWAMATLGFEDYVEPLKLYLQKFRELEGDKSFPTSVQSQMKESFSPSAAAAAGGDGGGGIMMMGKQIYGSSPLPFHPNLQHQMAGKGSFASGTANPSPSSSSSPIGIKGQGRRC